MAIKSEKISERNGLEVHQSRVTKREVFELLLELQQKHGDVGAQALIILAATYLYVGAVPDLTPPEIKELMDRWATELGEFMEQKLIAERMLRQAKEVA